MNEDQIALEYARNNYKVKLEKYGADHPRTKQQATIVRILEAKAKEGKKSKSSDKPVSKQSKGQVYDNVKKALKDETTEQKATVPATGFTSSY